MVLLEQGEVVADGEPHDAILTYREHDLAHERAGAIEADSGGRRVGDGAATIEEAWIERASGERTAVFPQGERVTVRARVVFAQPMEDPVFGLIVKGEAGEQVMATNTVLTDTPTGTFTAGEEAVYAVSFDAHLADGRHAITLAVSHQDVHRIADWREEVLMLAVRAPRFSGGLVDLPHEVQVERVAASGLAPR